MISFNSEMVKTWKGCGYNFIHVVPFEKYGVLQPLVHDKDVKKGYTIFIDEMNLIQMAEDYFLTKEKFALQSAIQLLA
ncbi:MAG TPA: hypothetical protein VIM65_16995 [Cyclobacteriaceae bacterium]